MAEHEQRNGTDLYAVLGLTPDATSQEIRAAYQQLAGSIVAGQASPIQRQAIEEAFETLGDPIRRLRYDAQAAAPPPPRFQMPSLRLSGRRLSLPTGRLRTVKRPDLPHVDPMLAAAIALVVIVGVVVVLLPLVRGRGKPSAPAQSVADLVTPTATLQAGSPTANAGAQPTARSPILGAGPGGFGQPGSGPSVLPPLSSGSSQAIPPGGLLGQPSTGPQGAGANEPPFLTGTAILDMLRAVAAASAVRNAPPPNAAAPPPSVSLPPNGSSTLLQPNPVSAGVPITSVGSIPPLAGAGQPSTFPVSAAAAPTTAPTATPAPNHIAVPGAAVSALGVSAPGASGPRTATATAPNRFVPAPTPIH